MRHGVLHLERGEWKIVQAHWSLPTANEVLGMTLTVSLDRLEQTIQRERPDLSSSLAADGTVTIVFTDIVDSTVLTARLGDHAWLDVVRRHNDVIRIGVHTGDAVHEADHFFGTTVNYAARVASHALGGEVLASNLVHELVAGSGIGFLESRDVELKGLDGLTSALRGRPRLSTLGSDAEDRA